MRLFTALFCFAAAVAAAGPPAEEALRVEIDVLQGQAAALKTATAAPRLSGELSDFMVLLADVAAADASRADAAGRLQERAAVLQDAVRRRAASSKPMPGFYRGVAEQLRMLAADASALIAPADSSRAAVPPAPTRSAAQVQADLERSRGRIASTLSGDGNFDGSSAGPRAAPLAQTTLPAVAPAPAPAPVRTLSRTPLPRYDADLAALQTALSVVRRAAGLRRISNDGLFGAGTEAAVADFQGRASLPETGILDAATQTALIEEFQRLKGLAVTGVLDTATARAAAAASRRRGGHYFLGSAADFGASQDATEISGVLATVYTPFLAESTAARRREGVPHDRFMQTICTLERFVAGSCPYVSVAIDSRLNVPDGTPVLIPGIDRIAGRPVLFRITDTGSRRLFHGTGHVDIATDSTQYGGFGSRISGREFTLLLPRGLHPAQP